MANSFGWVSMMMTSSAATLLCGTRFRIATPISLLSHFPIVAATVLSNRLNTSPSITLIGSFFHFLLGFSSFVLIHFLFFLFFLLLSFFFADLLSVFGASSQISWNSPPNSCSILQSLRFLIVSPLMNSFSSRAITLTKIRSGNFYFFHSFWDPFVIL